MMEFLIIAVVVLWSIFAIKNSRKHGCCGDCAKCAARCKGKDENKL